VLCGTLYVGLFALAALGADFELLHALTVVPVLFAITIPIAVRIGRRDGDPTLVSIILAAFAAKLLMAYVRYQLAYSLQGGRTDATVYDLAGRALVPQLRQFDFSIETGRFIGTGFVNFLTGIVYSLFGTGRMVGFFVFAWISFLGFLLLARAFRLGVPDGDSRRYMIAVLFLPSLLFWPAIIGKEAWMMLGIGLASYGIAALFRGRSVGVVPFAAGIGAMLLVRPHMALLVVAATLVASVVRRAVVPVPGGLGVRESVFIALAELSEAQAVTVAIVSRAILIVVDVAGAALAASSAPALRTMVSEARR